MALKTLRALITEVRDMVIGTRPRVISEMTLLGWITTKDITREAH